MSSSDLGFCERCGRETPRALGVCVPCIGGAARELGAPPRQIGKYRLGEPIGEGGMGTVYRAYPIADSDELQLEREVALKVMRRDRCSEMSRAQFLRELTVAYALEHPNIIRVYDAGIDCDEPYYVMEYARAGALTKHKSDFRDPILATRLLIEIALGLHFAHERTGIVHQDLKPANILLDADHRPRLADFGLAALASLPGAGRQGGWRGSLRYLSPEQAGYALDEGRPVAPVDRRSDVYALGAVLHELLCAQTLHQPADLAELHACFARGPVRSLRRRIPMLGHDLEAVCLKALSLHPDDRYQTALAFADDLRNVLGARPTQARAHGLSKQLLSWSARNSPLLAAALGVLLATGVVLLLVLGMRTLEVVSIAKRAEREAIAAGRATAQAFARDPRVIEATQARTGLAGELLRKYTRRPFIHSAYVLDLDGRVLMHEPLESPAYFSDDRFKDRFYFKNAGPVPYVGPLIVSIAKDHLLKIPISANINRGPTKVGVAVVTIAVRELARFFGPHSLALVAPLETAPGAISYQMAYLDFTPTQASDPHLGARVRGRGSLGSVGAELPGTGYYVMKETRALPLPVSLWTLSVTFAAALALLALAFRLVGRLSG